MKVFFLVILLFTSSLSFAGQSICKGRVWVRSAFFPLPVRRDAVIFVSPSLNEIQGNVMGEVIIGIGGTPIDYKGMIYPRGDQDQTLVDPASKDVTSFKLEVLSRDALKFKMTFTNSDREVLGSVSSATLSCQ